MVPTPASLSPWLVKSGFCTGVPFPRIQGMNLIALANLSISIPLASRTLGGSWERVCSSSMLSPHVRIGTVVTIDGT